MKKHMSTFVILGALCVGLALLLYPTVSDYWNQRVQSRAVASYRETVEDLGEDERAAMLQAASAYNAELRRRQPGSFYQPDDVPGYESTLDVGGTGIMGYITIEKIGVELPIYHGTSDGVLQVAAGHLEGSSLPLGGPSSHTVITGHRGLPSAKLFTELDRLEVGDTFVLTVLGEQLTYRVERISIVEPQEVDMLQIEDGQDLCTLVTCTPYGVNSHRLLVRGVRVPNLTPGLYVQPEALRIEPLVVVPAVALPLLAVVMAALGVRQRVHRRREQTLRELRSPEGRWTRKDLDELWEHRDGGGGGTSG